jgi:hypothetical protein
MTRIGLCTSFFLCARCIILFSRDDTATTATAYQAGSECILSFQLLVETSLPRQPFFPQYFMQALAKGMPFAHLVSEVCKRYNTGTQLAVQCGTYGCV